MAVFTYGNYNCACSREVCDWACATYATMMSNLVPNTASQPLAEEGGKRRMTDDEIFYKIGSDVAYVVDHMFGVRGDITIWMTKDLFNRLFPKEFVLLKDNSAMTTLFGCKVRVVIGPCDGMWWIVGYEGKAEEGKDDS